MSVRSGPAAELPTSGKGEGEGVGMGVKGHKHSQ